MKNPHLHLFIK